MTEPMTAQRLAEIDESNGRLDDLTDSLGRTSAEQHRRELLAEVKRLNARLAEFTDWEPTVREEYEHACAVAERAEAVVKKFEAGDFRGETDPFLAALKNALEMT